MGLITGSLVALLVALDQVAAWGWGDTRVIALLVVAALSMAAFVAREFMEKQLGFSPLQAGAGLLPLMLVFGATSFASAPLYERLGGRTVILAVADEPAGTAAA